MARKMKDSGIEWIGEIPEGWEVTKIKHIVSSVTDIDHFMPDSVESGIPYLMIGNLKDLSSSIDWDSSKKISIEDYKKLSIKSRPQKGDIIFARYASIGTTCYIDTDRDFLVSYACLTIHPSDLIIGKFLSYYLKSSSFAEDVLRRTNSNTQGNVGKDSLVNATIVLPSIIEQTQIVNFLEAKCSDINAMLSKTRSSIEEYKKLKQSVITQAVTKGVRGEREMKPTGFTRWSEIPSDWELKRVKPCAASITSGLSAVTDDTNSEESGNFVLRTSAVSSGFFVPTEVKPVLKSAVNRLICPVEPDTLIVSRMNTASMVGACAYVANNHPNTFLPDKLWKIKFHSCYHTKYMWYALNSVPAKSWFSELATGASSSMQNISINDFTSNYLPIPAFSEQKEIAAYLDAKCAEIDGLIAKKEQLVKELESYKKSLIYEVVTGKREV